MYAGMRGQIFEACVLRLLVATPRRLVHSRSSVSSSRRNRQMRGLLELSSGQTAPILTPSSQHLWKRTSSIRETLRSQRRSCQHVRRRRRSCPPRPPLHSAQDHGFLGLSPGCCFRVGVYSVFIDFILPDNCLSFGISLVHWWCT